MTNPPAYPRETNEWIPAAVTANGAPAVDGVSFAVVVDGQRPTAWTPGIVRDLEGTPTIGFAISGLAPGAYRVFARPSDPPYAPVIGCGLIYID